MGRRVALQTPDPADVGDSLRKRTGDTGLGPPPFLGTQTQTTGAPSGTVADGFWSSA